MTATPQSRWPAVSNGLELAARNNPVRGNEIARRLAFHFVRIRSTCICMKNPPADSHFPRRFAPTALMLGNIVTGCSVLAEKRGTTIAYIFLGWSLATAVSLPLITFIASRYGWRAAYGGIALLGCLSFLLLAWRLPCGLVGSPVDLKTWADVGRDRTIVLLLSITTLQMSGQFVVLTFMGRLLTTLPQAGRDAVGLVFAIYGVFGFIGIAVATRIVDSWGAYKTSLLFMTGMLTGLTGWAISAGRYPLMACSVAIWGLGFASTNSM